MYSCAAKIVGCTVNERLNDKGKNDRKKKLYDG